MEFDYGIKAPPLKHRNFQLGGMKMKNIMLGISILMLIAISRAVLADTALLRLYTDRVKGDT